MNRYIINVFDEIEETSLESAETWTTYDNIDDAIDNARECLKNYKDEHLIIATIFLEQHDDNIDMYAISNLNKAETARIRHEKNYTNLYVNEYLK